MGRNVAERMFDGSRAEGELEESLLDAGVSFDRLGWDSHDCSVELYGIPSDYRLSENAQRVIHAAGFGKAYVNHKDNWETHYHFKPNGDFSLSDGWRVSYPHKRGPQEKSIWVEKPMPDWPKNWFDSGYVVIHASL